MTVVLTKSGQIPSVFGYSFFRVMTGSMEPTIPTDSFIAVKKTDASELQVGDVISFYSRDPSLSGSVNTHRIVEITEEDGQYIFITQGDANNTVDVYNTLESDIIGKVVYHSYRIGMFVRLVSNPLIFIPLVAIPLGLMIIINLYQTVKTAKALAKEEEEAAVREALQKVLDKKKSDGTDNSDDQDRNYDD